MALDYRILAGLRRNQYPTDTDQLAMKGVNAAFANRDLNRLKGVMNQELAGDPMMRTYAGLDPISALKMHQEERQRNLTNERKFSQDPATTANVKELAVQYRADLRTRFSGAYGQMDDREREALDASIEGKRALLRRSELGRAILGETEEQLRAQATNTKKQKADEGETTKKDEATELKKTIDTKRVDVAGPNGPDGIIDDIISLHDMVRTFATKYGEADPAVKDVTAYLADTIENVRAKFEARGRKKKENQENVDRSIAQDEKYKWLYGPYSNIKQNPNSTPAKLDALMTALRKESGAAIGADEFVSFMKTALSGKDLEKFNSETTGLIATMGTMLPGKVSDNYLKNIANNYISKANSDKIIEKLGAKIPDEYLRSKGAEKKTPGSAGTEKKRPRSVFDTKKAAKPNRKDFEKMADYLRALKAWKKENP